MKHLKSEVKLSAPRGRPLKNPMNKQRPKTCREHFGAFFVRTNSKNVFAPTSLCRRATLTSWFESRRVTSVIGRNNAKDCGQGLLVSIHCCSQVRGRLHQPWITANLVYEQDTVCKLLSFKGAESLASEKPMVCQTGGRPRKRWKSRKRRRQLRQLQTRS